MNRTTAPAWKARADRLGIPASTISKATGVSESSVRKYANGDRTPSETWLVKVDWLLTDIERAVERGGSAA